MTKTIHERINEIATDSKSNWLKKAKRRKRWRWFMMNKYVLKIRFKWAGFKIWYKNSNFNK